MAVFFIKCALILHLVIIFDISMQVSSAEEIILRSTQFYACPPRAYLDMTPNKTACRACTVCPPGYGVEAPCSLTTDTVCEPCPKGTYNPRRTLTERCRRCRRCSYPHVSVGKCQPHRDASCNWCAKGYYFDSVVSICVRCAYCFPEIPNLTSRIPACGVPGVDKNKQCVPISNTRFWQAEAKRRRKVINRSRTETSIDTSTEAVGLNTQTLQSREFHAPEEEPTLETIVVITVMIMMLIAVIFLIVFCVFKDRHKDVCGCYGKGKRQNYNPPVSTLDVRSQEFCLLGKPPIFVADRQVGGKGTCVVDLPEKIPL